MSTDTPENSELTEDDVRAVVRDELNNHDEDGEEISRRDFGKAGVLAALGLGGAAGVGGRQVVKNAVDPAQAASGTEGKVGTESNPVDFYTDEVDFGDFIFDMDGSGNLELVHETSGTSWTWGSGGSFSTDELSGGVTGNNTLNSVLGPGIAIHNGELVSYVQSLAKTAAGPTGAVWTGSRWQLKHKTNADGASETYSPFRVSQGTSTTPAVFEWKAQAFNPQSGVDLFLGVGEEMPTMNIESIFLKVDGGVEKFQTTTGGTVTSTDISASVDSTVEHTYKVEWTNEPRATLYVDGSQVVEHTTNIPSVDIAPFFEILQSSNTLSTKPAIEVSDSLLRSGITP